MSEYQYYEFQTVDRSLTEMEMAQLRRCSTRATITSASFINEYNWGDFKGNTNLWMEKYFDGHLYYANWGTRILQLAVPESCLPVETTDLYCVTDAAWARQKSGRVILGFGSEENEFQAFEESPARLSSLLQLRRDLMAGDLRCLYLGWLLGLQSGEMEDEALEPPVPPNLGQERLRLTADSKSGE